MRRKGSPNSHTQILEWLRRNISRKMEGKKYEIYEDIKEVPELLKNIEKAKKDYKFHADPNLPVDLICVEKRKEPIGRGRQKTFSYYTIFLVASTDAIPESLESRIIFYKFYLSRIISSKRLQIVLAILDSTKEIDEDFLRYNGIGFWKFLGKNGKLNEVFPALSQRDQMAKEFEESKPKNVALFFDKYLHDAVDAIAGVTPEQFGKRYIDRKVMDKIFELEKISYREELFKVMNEHLTEKGDEYQLASEVFSKLWEECVGIEYTDFLKTFEPSLQHVFAQTREETDRIYRDHYLHQFQVFLLGLYILDKLYDDFAQKHNKPEISWLITSSFHDMAYPVEKYDEWSGKFFKKVFKVPKDLAHVELKSNFVDKSFLTCMSYLISRLCLVVFKEEVRGNWLAEKNDLVNLFYKRITEAKSHCILSSISLLKMVQDPKYTAGIKLGGNPLEDIFVPSALAIALHDKDVWRELKNGGKGQKLTEKGRLPILRFEDDPLSFLLIFCDNVQEWGRPSKSETDETEKGLKRFYLKDLKYDPKVGFDVTIWTPNHVKDEKFFIDKKLELKEVEGFLQQPPNMKFAIRLEDKNQKWEDFEMHGSRS
jgi:hypothetical protein